MVATNVELESLVGKDTIDDGVAMKDEDMSTDAGRALCGADLLSSHIVDSVSLVGVMLIWGLAIGYTGGGTRTKEGRVELFTSCPFLWKMTLRTQLIHNLYSFIASVPKEKKTKNKKPLMGTVHHMN